MCGFVWSVVGGGWLWSVVVGGDWWCLGGGGGCCIYIYCKYISIYVHNRRVVNSFFDYDYRYLHSETSASPAYCCYISCIFFSSQCKVATDFLQHLGVPLKVTIISAAQGVDGIAFLAGMYGSAPKQKISGEISGGFSRWNLRGNVLGRFPELWQKMSPVWSIPISAAECLKMSKNAGKGQLQHVSAYNM